MRLIFPILYPPYFKISCILKPSFWARIRTASWRCCLIRICTVYHWTHRDVIQKLSVTDTLTFLSSIFFYYFLLIVFFYFVTFLFNDCAHFHAHVPTRLVRVKCITAPTIQHHIAADSGVMVYGWVVITP